MFDAYSEGSGDTGTRDFLTCDLCIVGAGIAGLNALFVATEYLPRTARVVLIDRNPRAGGMWTETYPYIRLHQPHGSFTVGDIPWNWDKPQDYLATGAEVAAHLEHCLDQLRDKVELVELWGHEVKDRDEIVAGSGPMVRVRCQSMGPRPRSGVIQARKLIDATGLDVPRLKPLPLKSARVTSTTPQDLRLDGTGPVFVIGGGKTGMDTCLEAIRAGREVTLINGRGTVFANRDASLPRGWRRWLSGRLVMSSFADIAMRFDGTNEDAVFDYFKKTYAIAPTAGTQFFFGFLSEAERAEIAGGLTAVHGDYLADVVDAGGTPELVLSHGGQIPVPRGSVFVNCTGHLLTQNRAYTPYLSPQGAILTITTRSAVHFQSSVAAYFLSHMFLLDRLRDAPLYELDLNEVMGKGRKVWQMTTTTHAFMNALILMEHLPGAVLARCGLDIDRWFPLPRRILGFLDISLKRRRYIRRCRDVLDRVRTRLGIRCGRLPDNSVRDQGSAAVLTAPRAEAGLRN